jgi:hypothetical protein
MSILEEAHAIIIGPRREAYGSVEESFERVATMWSVLLGKTVTREQVALCMVALKLCREMQKPGRDNRVDICGYTALLDHLNGGTA